LFGSSFNLIVEKRLSQADVPSNAITFLRTEADAGGYVFLQNSSNEISFVALFFCLARQQVGTWEIRGSQGADVV
jgi:hypothetical protein